MPPGQRPGAAHQADSHPSSGLSPCWDLLALLGAESIRSLMAAVGWLQPTFVLTLEINPETNQAMPADLARVTLAA